MSAIGGMLHTLEQRMVAAIGGVGAAALGIGLALVLLAASTLVVARWVAHLPADHFIRPRSRPAHPLLALSTVVARNGAGALLLALGLMMAVPGVPGPGVAVMFIGFALLDFPGKRALELRLLSRPRLRAAVDHLRARHGQPPLQLDPTPAASDGRGAATGP